MEFSSKINKQTHNQVEPSYPRLGFGLLRIQAELE